MARYVVFTGESRGSQTFRQLTGYLYCLTDQRTLNGKITGGVINSSAEVHLYFPGDEGILKIIDEMSLSPPYQIARAEILDESVLEQIIPNLNERFKLKHKIYEEP